MSSDGINQIAVVNGGKIYVSVDSGATWVSKDSDRDWKSVTISEDGLIQTAVVFGGQIHVHPFAVDQNISLKVKITDIGVDTFNTIYFDETTTTNPELLQLNGFNMADALNYTVTGNTDPGVIDIYLPNGNYTPQTLGTTLNTLITNINPLFTDAFSYNDVTRKFIFASIYSGTNVISLTNLLEQMGITELPSSVTALQGIVGTNIANPDFTGPLNIFIKSDILSSLRKSRTPFSINNKKIVNIISPLELNYASDYYNLPTTIELFLNKKTTISTFDIQIVDENGNIVNLNGSPIRINFYFYNS
jgi:hypothetical protein